MTYRQIALPSSLAALISLMTFAWYHDWIVIAMPALARSVASHGPQQTSYKNKISLFFPKNGKEQQETKEMLWSDDLTINARALTQTWAALLDEESVVHNKVTVQSAAVTFTNDELIISFDRPPFNKDDALHKKLELLETLLKTVRLHLPTLQKVHFLVNHQPLKDYHLDFSQPWPIQGFSENSALTTTATPLPSQCTIVIDPAGDARHTGRIIDETFERTITLQCAQELKQALEQRNPYARVMLTRMPGETVEPLQNATFANRLQADLFISIHCYQETSVTPRCSLYRFSYNPATDAWYKKDERLHFVPLHLAYQDFAGQSDALINHLQTSLRQSEHHQHYIVEQPRACPCEPLLGVHSPAVCIEMGLAKKDDWQLIIRAIAQEFTKYSLKQ